MKLKKIFIAGSILVFLSSCQNITTPEPEMSFDEAKDVVLSMQNIPMQPPPRKMDDILAILETSKDVDTENLNALINQAEILPPNEQNPKNLYQFYKSRAYARYELSRFKESRADIRTAIAYDEQVKIRDGTLYHKLAELEMLAGRYKSALDLSKTAIRTGPYRSGSRGDVYKVSSWRLGPYYAFQSRVHHRMGNFFRANMAIRNAKAAYQKVPKRARLSLIIDGGKLDMGNENDILAAEAEMIEAQGRYGQAHELRARLLNYHFSKRKEKPLGSIHAQMAMATNLMRQGRLILAEKEARHAVIDAVRVSGRYSGITADAVQTLCEIILAKGDLQNAYILSTAQIDILTRLGLSIDEDIMVRSQLLKARVLVAKEDFLSAMTSYDLALKGMEDNSYLFKRYVYRNLGLMLCLIQNDRISEADELIRQTKSAGLRFKTFGSYDAIELQALEAMILYNNNRTGPALERFSTAVPGLVSIIQDPNLGFEKCRFADILLRIYIDILLQLYHHDDYQTFGIDVSEEMFKLADAQRSKVNRALSESCVRAASLTDPELSELVRQEQDAGKRIKSLQTVLFNAAAASENASGGSLASLERSIQSLIRARTAIIERIEKKFPKYRDYVQPVPPSLSQVQAQLAPGEAFIAIWTLAEKTCVWAISNRKGPKFTVIDMGKQAVEEKVHKLRRALKHNAYWLSQVPDYDVATAFSLYNSLLAPVLPVWNGATALLVVVKGPLDQIPLAVLTTEPTTLKYDADLRFKGYRNAPWLIRKTSITRLPSASALITLRNLPEPSPNREPFIGFGDPIFKSNQRSASITDSIQLTRRSTNQGQIAIRGIRFSDKGELDSAEVTSADLENLHPLPDTAEEIQGIASILGVDKNRNVFLRREASETNIKTKNLNSKKIITFATHALLPGDLDGLTQPALAFSSPEVTGLDEDGLLTVGEILTLKLDADLVILSACDTGAGNGRGSEAVSGLGRAFFYAGARALLVTMWPVETTSARKLTTGLFRFQRENPKVSRSKALQNSILDLLDNRVLKDPDSGEDAAAYAHPMFWAPFIIVGDGGT